MNRFLFVLIFVVFGMSVRVHAAERQVWRLTSPDHGQTYSYGIEKNRSWTMLGPDRHLALYATFSNNPFAEGSYQRFDNFVFNFPQITLGPDGETFFYRPSREFPFPWQPENMDFSASPKSTSYLPVTSSSKNCTAISPSPW